MRFYAAGNRRNETPWDLRVLLYIGGAKASPKRVFNQIANAQLGPPVVERLELVKAIHNVITARLVGGGARQSQFTTLRALRGFVVWADENGLSLSLDRVEASYVHWSDFLLHRARLHEITAGYAYKFASSVSHILSAALERSQPLITATRHRPVNRGQRAVGAAADKQNLNDTVAFCHLCQDVIDSLSVEVVFGPLPVPIRLRDGRVLEQWSGLRDPKKVSTIQPEYRNKTNQAIVLQLRNAWEADRTLRTRAHVVNLRILAELMVFISQTGMNLSQAHQLRRRQFSYKSTIDGYEVRDYKQRRKGEVLFEVFAEYRAVFQRYLDWLDAVFVSEPTDSVFPLIRQGARTSAPPYFKRFKEHICKRAGVPFISPRMLRKTRVNWLLRRSRDPRQTAEMAQHTVQTLLQIYEKPSLQVAQTEIIQFWQRSDPRLSSTPVPCPAPGVCDGAPERLPGLPPEAPTPDCTNPAGCLFCQHHRDVDSGDYVWSATSMRHLQTIILPRFRPLAKGKGDAARHVELTIEVLTAKLKWFSESNALRKAWVSEATARIAEGDFHVHWRYLIESAEGA